MKSTGLAALCLGFLAILGGCRSREDVPYLGRWDGSFVVDRVTAKTQVKLAKRNNWSGYLLLYRTQDEGLGNRCQMHLENEQEEVDLKGHWKVISRQLQVSFNDIKIDDAGGVDMEDPNKAYLQSAEIRSAFSIPLTLNVAENRKALGSPVVNLGPLLGTYSFKKATLAR